ncbi:type II toxin-antitoxin system RelE/ParE family toxin [Oceanobacillus sp. AG]|uniref:type II toxin-antitoxin system RelE/ParE family toxin n=1 Tax=Oceanobacillus sp. AG TaxID=2681969 RepID=UPI0012EC49FE|nr:type II toxin-antitoxin system RelE/ParE family toxin [Oceanobacillus sp. AG]
MEVEGFEKDLIKIARKYPSSIDLVASLFERFEEGNIEGNDIGGLKLKGDKVFKTRLENPDANKGKSGGFRVIWYLVTSDNEIYPLTIYSKNEQDDIPNREIISLISKRVSNLV